VGRTKSTKWFIVPAAAACLLLICVWQSECRAQNEFGSDNKPSFTQSVKNSFNKVGESISPKSKNTGIPSDDPTLLTSQGKPSAELYVSMGKYYEEADKPIEAEGQYKKALREKPTDLVVMLTYAHFLENQNRYLDAVEFYQKTSKVHPKEASVYNNMGLCFARNKKIKEASTALDQAVRLEPRNILYRNNLAALLVEQNRLSEAFETLRYVHGEANAYYNLGYLLSKKGNTEAAEHHFAQALMLDPTMQPAQRWLAYLHGQSQPSSMERNFKVVNTPRVPNRTEDQVATRIAPPSNNTPTPVPQSNLSYQEREPGPIRAATPAPVTIYPGSKSPKRLPPVGIRQPVGNAPGDGSDLSDSAPLAPLPPGLISQ
jgi:Tfp pilus assembly protein PilF